MHVQKSFSDVHLAKVHRVHKHLAGPVFGISFEEYLNGTDSLEPVHAVPVWPEAWAGVFDRDVLVDGRIVDKVGLDEACRLVGIHCDSEKLSVPRVAALAEKGVRWMRGQDGRRNCGRPAHEGCDSFKSFEVGMDAIEAVFAYTDDTGVVSGHYPILVGSKATALLGMLDIDDLYGHCEFELTLWHPLWENESDPRAGVASRGNLILKP